MNTVLIDDVFGGVHSNESKTLSGLIRKVKISGVSDDSIAKAIDGTKAELPPATTAFDTGTS